MNVPLPRYFNIGNVSSFVNQVIDENRIPKSSEFTFDFTELKFIEPAGITALSSIVEFLIKNGATVEFYYFKTSLISKDSALSYLDDSMFFNRYLNVRLNPNSSIRNSSLALEQIDTEGAYQWTELFLLPWLKREIGLDKRLRLESLRISLIEIFNNISDHSDEKIACLFAQHYPNKKQIRLAISDFGKGIPENVKKVMPTLADSMAIQKATEAGFSTHSKPTNRGAGLDLLKKNIVNDNGGNLTILSNKGILYINKGIAGTEDYRYYDFEPNLSGYPGTLIHLNINTELYIGEEEKEEFQW
ncbi:hypothetical protein AB3N59_20500 (plasmid) [Leptospira sp. WS92.C1]